jgi:bilirubin oxidase
VTSTLVVLTIGAWTVPEAFAAIPGGSLDPTTIPKYQEPLIKPPAMPPTSTAGNIDYYEIAVRQFRQQILPTGFPMTTVWSYGSVNHAGTFNYPAFTIEAQVDTPVRVKWINDLKDPQTGRFLPHLLPVDQTLHWANPPRVCTDMGKTTDCRGRAPVPYTGPVPIVTHLHGSHAAQESDGFAEAWYLPAATNIPANYAATGSFYDFFKTEFFNKFGETWTPGTATFRYENDQRAATLWYHDHTLGMTRLNVYAGPAGFYLLRGKAGNLDEADDLAPGVLPGPAPGLGANPFGTFYEIPIAIQDRSFNRDGSLFYAASRTFFESFLGDGFRGPFIPASDVSPIWNPEFFANTIVVNGRTWPKLEVEPRRYRFRFLNGCNSRFLILRLATDNTPQDGKIDDGDYTTLSAPFWQIGSEGGFLPNPVNLHELLMGLAERADVIIDFGAIASSLPPGTDALYLVNVRSGRGFRFRRSGDDRAGHEVRAGRPRQHGHQHASRRALAAFAHAARRGRQYATGVPQRGHLDLARLRGAHRRSPRHRRVQRGGGAGGHSPGMGRPDHGERDPRRDRGLGDVQLHGGRAPHPHPRGAVPGRRA